MDWKGKRRSTNVEDRRGMSSGGKLALGGVGGVVVLIIGLLMGGDPGQLLQQMQTTGVQQTDGPVEISAEEQELTEMVEVVFASTEAVWSAILASAGSAFDPSILVRSEEHTTELQSLKRNS